MKKFRFTAKNAEGKNITGVREAKDQSELHDRLRETGLFLVSCRELQSDFASKRIKEKYLAEFCRELGTLLEAGVPLVRALAILTEEENVKPRHRMVYGRLLVSVRQGEALSDAMESQKDAFPALLVNMIRTAERSGSMPQTCLQLGKYYDREYRVKSKLKSTLAYPAVLGVLIVAVVVFLFTCVLPQFQVLFQAMESLPWYTRFLMALSDFLRNYWFQTFLALAVLGEAVHLLFLLPRIRRERDRWKLHLPVLGRLLRTIYTARFARTLSSLYTAGLPMISALQIGSRIIGNAYLEEQFVQVIEKVRAGQPLSAALLTVDGFVKKFSSAVMIGEETGKLDEMLESMAESLDYEAEQAIDRMMTLIEPAMIVMMAVIVGFIMIAVITPIYGSYQSLGDVY